KYISAFLDVALQNGATDFDHRAATGWNWRRGIRCEGIRWIVLAGILRCQCAVAASSICMAAARQVPRCFVLRRERPFLLVAPHVRTHHIETDRRIHSGRRL